MNIGNNIIACVLRDQDVIPFLDAGMNLEWLESKDGYSEALFDGDDYDSYRWILRHYTEHRKTPTTDLFLEAHKWLPGKYLSQQAHSSSELVELGVQEVQRLTIAQSQLDIDAVLVKEHDVPAAVEVFLRSAQRLAKGLTAGKGTFTILGDTAFDLEAFMAPEQYEGVPMGIPSIDDDFGGFQPGQLITFLGRQKAMKTMMMLYSSYWAFDAGHRVLFYSVELDETMLRQRLYGIGAGVNPERFRRNRLNPIEKESIRALQHDMEIESGRGVDYAISKKTAQLNTDDIAREIDEFQPTVVYVDGFYFMRDSLSGESAGSDWRANETVAQSLKELAMGAHVPIITSTQVQEKQNNRKQRGIEASTIQGGTGLLKASDLVLGLDKEQGDDEVLINCVYSRFAPVSDISIKWNWDEMELIEIPSTERTSYEGEVRA